MGWSVLCAVCAYCTAVVNHIPHAQPWCNEGVFYRWNVDLQTVTKLESRPKKKRLNLEMLLNLNRTRLNPNIGPDLKPFSNTDEVKNKSDNPSSNPSPDTFFGSLVLKAVDIGTTNLIPIIGQRGYPTKRAVKVEGTVSCEAVTGLQWPEACGTFDTWRCPGSRRDGHAPLALSKAREMSPRQERCCSGKNDGCKAKKTQSSQKRLWPKQGHYRQGNINMSRPKNSVVK